MNVFIKIFKNIFFISTCFVVILSYFFSVFIVPDDIAMLTIVSGSYSSTPDFHIIFMNVWIGYCLSFLYNFYKGIEWYTLFFLVLHIFSFAFQLKYIRRIKRISSNYRLIIIVTWLLIQYNFITQLQFTTVALNVGLASLFIYMMKEKGNVFQTITACLLLLISFSIRNFLGVMILSCIFLFSLDEIKLFIKSLLRKKIKITKRLITLVVLSGSFTFLFIWDNSIYFNNDDYTNFKKLESYRALINDGVKLDIGFSENKELKYFDYHLIKGFMFDVNKYDYEYLEKLYLHSFKPNYKQRILNAIKSFFFYKEVLILYLSLIFFLYFKTKKSEIILQGLFLLIIFGLTSFVFDLVLKERFVVSLFLPYLILLLSYYFNLLKEKNNHIFGVVFLIILLFFIHLSFLQLFLFLTAIVLILMSSYFEQKRLEIISMCFFLAVFILKCQESKDLISVNKNKISELTNVVSVIQRHNDKRILTYPTHNSLTSLPIFRVSSYKFIDDFLFSGWMAALPYNKKQFPSFKYLVNNSIPIMLNNEDLVVIEWIQESIEFNYKLKTEKVIIYQDDNQSSFILKKTF